MNLITQLLDGLEEANLWQKKIELKRGEFLTQAGQIDTNLYYLEKGSLKLFFVDGEEEQIIRLGYQGNIIAALDTFVSEQPTDVFVQALKKTQLKVIQKTVFEAWINKDLANLYLWHKIINQLIFEQLEREKDILTSSPQLRYQRVLKRSPQLFQEIPNKYIASYLRMTPETLSRIKSLDLDQDL